MAKRFTDTEKWKKHFIRGLQAPYKLLWVYLMDEVSAAGIWDVDIDVAQLRLGVKLKKETAENLFREKIVLLDKGKKWFVPSFIDFQYGQLSEANRAHTQIILTLKKFNLIDDFFKVKPLTSPLQGDMDMVMVKDMEMVMDMDMDKVMGKEGEPEKKVTMPYGEEFYQMWQIWKDYKKREFSFKYKSPQSEQAAINELMQLSGGIEDIADKIIKQSMAKGWKGFFELKENNNGTTTSKSNGSNKYSDLERKLDGEITGHGNH